MMHVSGQPKLPTQSNSLSLFTKTGKTNRYNTRDELADMLAVPIKAHFANRVLTLFRGNFK